MKNIKYILLAGFVGMLSSCVSNLLDQEETTKISSETFWTSTDDALSSTFGVYNATRTLFATDYYYDGQGEFQNTRGKSVGSIGNGNWSPAGWVTSGFSSMWENAYRVINRANFTIENVEKMIERESAESIKKSLVRINGENHFLRALAYFRLIQNWGDVPFYTHVLSGNAEATSLSRTSITEIKTQILEDLEYASTVLPATLSKSERGRATQVAALAFKGKVELFWASWKKNGWPELDGFVQDAGEADTYYKQAAANFKKVIYDYGLELFGGGDPGTYQTPTYWQLFQPANEYCSEIIFSIQYGGPLLGQGESLMRDFGTRSTANAQCWIMPTNRLVDRYQSCTTGDFLPNLVLGKDETLPNGALNQGSYADRDWRMRSTLLWDGQKMIGLKDEGMTLIDSLAWVFGVKNKQNEGYIHNDANSQTGYIYRKWIRQETGASRTDGSQDFYLMRLADVYLMYCEAVNETEGPSTELVGLVNKIRERGNLPGLAAAKYADKDEFFKAIEQERIVELATEGQRPFDIRRWRKAKEIWGPANGNGLTLYNSHGERIRDEFKNASEIDFGKYYIYQISETERGRNPKLTQNTPWL